jgi:hypothetical protein
MILTGLQHDGAYARTLGESQTDDPRSASSRSRLRSCHETFRDRAALLAADIALAFSSLTVHDLTHLDALWEMVDALAGPNYPLSPPEGFVLGGAILIHDLGNGLAAYPGGETELQQSVEWKDSLAGLLRERNGRPPTPKDFRSAPGALVQLATEEALRMLHARCARELPMRVWSTRENGQLRLIHDDELRDYYGDAIGQIAESHWWDTDALENLTPAILAPMPGMPTDWTVDMVKVACLLRCADAAHLDSRRAPAFLRAIRRPGRQADRHWIFQSRLGRPTRLGDKLLYTAGAPFLPEHADAWWLCLDMLRLVDREIRAVNEVFKETNDPPLRVRPMLAVTGVAGVEDAAHFAKHVRTMSWKPVDVRVHVSDVPTLVTRLGGEALYGNDPTVPLRELIQNASDAVRARRYVEGRPKNWGTVRLTLTTDDEDVYLSVEDTGVGMSERVLSEHLLDFGRSFWSDAQVRREFPGLAASAFGATGKFGIGFFSVFMIGQRISVASRRYDAASTDVRVLEFGSGLDGRPLLRRGQAGDVPTEGGTRIRIKLVKNPFRDGGLLHGHHRHARRSRAVAELADVAAWLAPSLDVDLVVESNGQQAVVVHANDWRTLDARKLLSRLVSPWASPPRGMLEVLATNLRAIEDGKGSCLARTALVPRRRRYDDESVEGVVTVGGLRAAYLTGISGLMEGTTDRAARDVAIPLASGHPLAAWASEQADLLCKSAKTHADAREYASFVRVCGGNPGALPVAISSKGHLTFGNIVELARELEELILVQDAAASNAGLISRAEELDSELDDNVLLLEAGIPGVLQSYRPRGDFHAHWPPGWKSVEQLVEQAVAESWGCSSKDVARRAERASDANKLERIVGRRAGKPLPMRIMAVLRRPTRPLE